MNSIYLSTILLVLSAMLPSCNKSEVNCNFHECNFEQIDENMDGLIDETERMIMDECMKNSLSSKSSIESNIIGEWKLIGHGEGWFPIISQPCGYITISKDELTFEFKNEYIDTIITQKWEIEALDSGYKLKVNPNYVEGLFITNFCENYMYGDATPYDGNMYLYEKVK